MNSLKAGYTLAALFCLFGCATPEKPSSQPPRMLYEEQQYDRCLTAIEAARKQPLRPFEQANLLLLEGICREEMNQTNQADELYRLLASRFPNTEYAVRATARRARIESDQREHFSLDFAPGKWQRVEKRWNAAALREIYIAQGDNPNAWHNSVTISAHDIPDGKRASSSTLLEKLKAALELEADRVTFKVIEEKPKEAIFEFQERNRPKIERESEGRQKKIRIVKTRGTGLGKVLLTPQRIHIIFYTAAALELDSTEKGKRLEALQRAHLINVQNVRNSRQ